MRASLRRAAVICALAVWIASPHGQEPAAPPNASDDEILVKFRPQADEGRRQAALNGIGGRRIKHFRTLDIDHVRVPAGVRAADAVAALRLHADVIAAQPNFARRATASPPPNDFFWINDVQYGFYALKKIHADQVWANYTTGSSSLSSPTLTAA